MAVVHQTTSLTPTHRQTTFEGLKVGAGYQHVKHIWVCFASRYCNASIASPDIIHTHTHTHHGPDVCVASRVLV